MVKFLTTEDISSEISKLIREAEEEVVIVSPYIKLDRFILSRIKDASQRNLFVKIIHGKQELSLTEINKIKPFKWVNIFYLENLHAKCYHNHKKMIICSMNLYEFSQQNNREMGLLIDCDSEKEAFQDAIMEIDSIISESKLERGKNPMNFMKVSNSIKQFLEMDEDYSETSNFHFISLMNFCKEAYNLVDVCIEDINDEQTLLLSDTPFDGINIRITHRIAVYFSNEDFYLKFSSKDKKSFEEDLADYRVYWNNYYFTVYPPKGYEPELTLDGLKIQVEMFAYAIQIIMNHSYYMI